QSTDEGLPYGSVHLKSDSEIRATGQQIVDQLQAGGLGDAAKRAEQATDWFARLHHLPAVEAVLIVRRLFGLGTYVCDIPLSQLMTLRCSHQFFEKLIGDPIQFWSEYNRLLEQYRARHGIENRVNPFPNLAQHADLYELPFWSIDVSTRRRSAVWCTVDDEGISLCDESGTPYGRQHNSNIADCLAGLPTDQMIVPRHALITALMRGLYCDLFVHGTGGGKYDQFTDELLQSRLSIEPPHLAVATASRYLLGSQRNELLRLEELAKNLRDMTYRPTQYFNTGAFTAETEQQLQALSAARADAVEQLKQLKSRGESARDVDHLIRDISNRSRELVERALEAALQPLQELGPDARQAVLSREYPWFLFAGGAN
ncbi:MAG: hypothetical protein KDB23_20770, partial [Planctomycetales bacterium]|nr:hypothetical protein [Planctomycetales bacterium]